MTFNAVCDLCRKSVTDLSKFKVLESRLNVKGLEHICDSCQTRTNNKLKAVALAHQNQMLNEVRAWLKDEQKTPVG